MCSYWCVFQAYAISAIAHWDWPENWSDLFDQLALYLESGEPNVVHGTLRVLTGKGWSLIWHVLMYLCLGVVRVLS